MPAVFLQVKNRQKNEKFFTDFLPVKKEFFQEFFRFKKTVFFTDKNALKSFLSEKFTYLQIYV